MRVADRLRTAGTLALALVPAVVGASWAVLAVAHADDRYRVDFVSGTWLALADYAGRGTLYPPLYEGGYLGGTRYMPLPVLLDAGIAQLTNDLLSGAKVATYMIGLALLTTLFLLLRRVGCPTLLALLVVTAVVVTPTGLVGTLGVRNDSLALVLQLGALLVLLRGAARPTVASAGVLVALALFAKVSAVWALIAIGIWLWLYARRLLLPYIAAFGATTVSGVVLFQILSDGRFLTNVVEFTFVGGRGVTAPLTDGVQAVVSNLMTSAEAVWLIVPFAVAALIWSVRLGKPTLFQLGFVVAAIVLTVVMASRGTDHNHLLDLCVLTGLVVGELIAVLPAGEVRRMVALLASLALLWGIGSTYQRGMGPETAAATRVLFGGQLDPQLARNPLAGLVRPGERLLSEDPTIPLFLGQRPVLTDSFIARRTLAAHPDWETEMSQRVSAREFDKIVVVAALEPGTGLFREQFLGERVNTAVASNYRLADAVRDIYVYVPVERNR